MISKLYRIKNQDQADLLIPQLEQANEFLSRGKGLLGRKKLEPDQALWIKPCNNIHTFFMKFPIDCVFLDKKMQISQICENVKPFRIVGPYWKAKSVVEFPAGSAEKWKLKLGDQLYVVS